MSKMDQVVIPAGFWIRLVALLIDSIILSIVMQAMLFVGSDHLRDAGGGMFAYKPLYYFIYFVILGGYSGAFYAIKGATPGKKVFSMQLVDNQSGLKVGFWRGFFREVIGKNVSNVTLGIGYIVAAFNKDKRTLHDYIFDTRVVKIAEIVSFPTGPSQEAAAEHPIGKA